jgi:hypothetical protein
MIFYHRGAAAPRFGIFSSSLAASPNGRRAKQIQREIRVLFRACFAQSREEIAGCPRAPFFGSFFGGQRKNKRGLIS